MPQLMSVPMASGTSMSGLVATTAPTGTRDPAWKSGVPRAASAPEVGAPSSRPSRQG